MTGSKCLIGGGIGKPKRNGRGRAQQPTHFPTPPGGVPRRKPGRVTGRSDAASPLTPHRAPNGARALPQGESGKFIARLSRHPEVRAKRASKDDGLGCILGGAWRRPPQDDESDVSPSELRDRRFGEGELFARAPLIGHVIDDQRRAHALDRAFLEAVIGVAATARRSWRCWRRRASGRYGACWRHRCRCRDRGGSGPSTDRPAW